MQFNIIENELAKFFNILSPYLHTNDTKKPLIIANIILA